MLKKMKVGKRLTVAFLMVTGITMIAAIVLLVSYLYTASQYSYALNSYGFSQGDVGKAMVTFAEVRSSTRAIIGYTQEEVIEQSVQSHDENREKFINYFADIEKTLTTDEEEAAYAKIEQLLVEFWQIDEEVIALGNTTDDERSKQAQTMAAEKQTPKFDEIYEEFTALMNSNVTNGNKMEADLQVLSTTVTIAAIMLMCISLVSAIALSRFIAAGVAVPLAELSGRLVKFSKGDLGSPFPDVSTQDEIGDMINAASEMANNLTGLLQDYGASVEQVAGGNFLVECQRPELYVGDFTVLREALQKLIGNLKETLLQIGEAAYQVDTGSQQLAENAQSLAQGATEQAGAVEELTATIESVAADTHISAEQAENAHKEAIGYQEAAEHGRRDMQDLVSAMENITVSSNEIQTIIAEIEDIASQTNLLSLNASIEAARAGEAGKGFAVVADQIGKLATDSAQSAVRTRELIQKTLQEITEGNQITNQTRETLDKIVKGIEFLSESSRSISEKARQQFTTMDEIEKGVEQISVVVQSNSASSQENSATSEELAAQAANLQTMIAQFTLK